MKTPEPAVLMNRLRDAMRAHDLDALVACFADDFESLHPAHPARSFRGKDQVRRNWAQILGAVPDLEAELLRCSVDGDDAWVEWRWTGQGGRFEMRGATLSRVANGRIASTRFFMEPVEQTGPGIDATVTRQVGA